MIAPMDISSSPAIIRRPMGSATMPTSAATLSQLAKPGERNELVECDDCEEDKDRNHAEKGPGFGTPEEPSQRRKKSAPRPRRGRLEWCG